MWLQQNTKNLDMENRTLKLVEVSHVRLIYFSRRTFPADIYLAFLKLNSRREKYV